MSSVNSFNVTYDQDSDVLYISKRAEPAARGIEDRWGIVWRYDKDGELIGATIVDFHFQWSSRRSLLTDEISKRFNIPEPQASVVVEHAWQL
jgi:uncharacterized protein YuzE